MPCFRFAILVTAAALALPALPALAQTADAPAAGDPAASPPAAHAIAKPAPHKAKARAKTAARKAKAADPAPEAAGRSAILGPSTDTGTRHRGLPDAPDDDASGQPGGSPVGMTLGGSNGLTPGMNMKF